MVRRCLAAAGYKQDEQTTVTVSWNSALHRWLIAIVALAPLPLGSHRPWAWTLLASSIGALLLIWGVGVLAGRARAPMPMRRLWPVAAAFGVLFLWVVLQALGDWVGAPHPIWSESAAVLGPATDGVGRAAVALDPPAAWTGLLKLAGYAGIFWLAVQLGRDRLRARQALVAMTVAAIAYASYGLVAYFSGSRTILWMDKWAYVDDLTATFVNRNAFGAYAGVGLVCCIGLALQGLRPRARRLAQDVAEDLLTRAAPFIVGGLLVGSALLLSHSRGALAATLVGILCLVVCLAVGGILRPRSALFALGGILAIGIAAVAVSGEATLIRVLAAKDEFADRENLYRIVLQAIGDAPLTGFGLGSFPAVFALYRDGSMLAPITYDFAHSVHLELLLELGWPGAGALYFAVFWILGTCVAGLVRRQRDQLYPAVAIASAVLLGAHGLIDFSVQMPAIAALLALLLGLGYAQSWNTASHAAGGGDTQDGA